MATGITVDFNANLTRFTSAIDKATSDLNRFQSNASRVSGNIGKAFSTLGIGLGVGAMVAFGKSVIDTADRLNDLKATTGLSLQNLASLSLLAKQSGTDLEGMAGSISKLSKNIGANEKEFRALGISSKEPLEAFKQLSDIFVGIEDPQKRAALAAKALGKSWEDAAPILELGGDEIGRLLDKNNSLTKGLADSAKAADEFNDNLEILKTSFSSVVSGAIPALSTGLNLLKNHTGELAAAAAVAASVFAARAAPALIAYGQQLSATTLKSFASRGATIAAAEAATFQHRALTTAFAAQIAAGRYTDAYTVSLRAQVVASTAATIAARANAASAGLAASTLAAFGGLPGVIAGAVTAIGLWAYTSNSAASDISNLATENNKLATSFNNVTAAESAARNAQLRIALNKLGDGNPAASNRIKELIESGVKVIRAEADAQARVQAETDRALNVKSGAGRKAPVENKDEQEKKRTDDLIKSNNDYIKSLQEKAATFGFTADQSAHYELSQKNLSDSLYGVGVAALQSAADQEAQADVMERWTDGVKEANKAIDDDKTAKANAYADAISRAFPERGEGLQYAEDVAAINATLDGTVETANAAAGAIEALGEKFNRPKEAAKSFADEFKETWADASRSFSDNFGRATADAFLNSTKGIDVLRTSVKSFARETIAALVSIAARKAIDFVLSKAALAGSTAANIAAGTATALAWAPAAAAVSLASFGGNSIPATAAIGSTYALTSSLALLGIAHDGLDNVPKTGTYLLEGGERVVKKEDNKRLEKFLDGGDAGGNINITFNVRGVDAPRASEIVAGQRGQIIGIIQGAYNDRLARGGPLR